MDDELVLPKLLSMYVALPKSVLPFNIVAAAVNVAVDDELDKFVCIMVV